MFVQYIKYVIIDMNLRKNPSAYDIWPPNRTSAIREESRKLENFNDCFTQQGKSYSLAFFLQLYSFQKVPRGTKSILSSHAVPQKWKAKNRNLRLNVFTEYIRGSGTLL